LATEWSDDADRATVVGELRQLFHDGLASPGSRRRSALQEQQNGLVSSIERHVTRFWRATGPWPQSWYRGVAGKAGPGPATTASTRASVSLGLVSRGNSSSAACEGPGGRQLGVEDVLFAERVRSGASARRNGCTVAVVIEERFPLLPAGSAGVRRAASTCPRARPDPLRASSARPREKLTRSSSTFPPREADSGDPSRSARCSLCR